MATHTAPSSSDDPDSSPEELAPYWPARIQEDRIWYRHYVHPDARFYSPYDNHVYRIDSIDHEGDVFALQPCSQTTDLGQHFTVPTEVASPHWIDNICALAGALECGDLVPLETGVIREIGSSTYLTIGSLTIAFPGTASAAEPLLESLDPPNGPATADIATLAPALDGHEADPVLYVPAGQTSQPSDTTTPSPPTPRGTADIPTHFVPVQQFSRWTFEDDTIRNWVEAHFEQGDTVLNACAGKTKLTPPPEGTIIRNDLNDDLDVDYSRDVAELAAVPELEPESIDLVVFDPPWSLYQSNLRYNNNHVSKDGTPEIDLTALPFETPGPEEKSQLGHARLAKESFDYLLRPGGLVLELTFHGSAMPARLGYERVSRTVFDPIGEARAVIGSADRKVRRELDDFL